MKAEPTDINRLLEEQGHLRGLSRPKARLKKLSLPGVDLSQARLSGADLTGANLSQALLVEADLSACYLVDADLSGANLEGADLRRARLKGANFQGANLRGARLGRTNLLEANLTDTDLTRADLSDAELTGLTLQSTILEEADLSRAIMGDCTLLGVNLKSARLDEVFLEKGRLEACNLELTQLTRANLVGIILRAPSSLVGARLVDADLAEATLEQVDFQGADLTGAILDQVVVRETRFEGAILVRTDFQGVRGLTDEQAQAARAAGAMVNLVFLEKLYNLLRARRSLQAAVLLFLLLAVSGGVFYYRSPRFRPIDKLLQDAQALRDAGKPAEALTLYELLLERVRGHLEEEISILYEKAETLSELDEPEKAAAIYATITAKAADDRDESMASQLKRGAALTAAGQFEAAIQLYKAIAEDATNSPKDVARALVALSQTYQKMGDEDQAMNLFQETLKRFPHDPEVALEVNFQMADMYIQRRLFSQAEQLLSQLEPMVRDANQRASLLILRARLFEELGDKARSLATFEELVKRYPESPDVSADVKMDLAQLMVDKGEYDWANRIYKDILNRAQDMLLKSQAQIAYGTLLRRMGKTEEALELFRTVRRQATDNWELQGASRLEEADTLVLMGKPQDALKLLDETLSAGDPSLAASALLRKGQVLEGMGRADEASKVYQLVNARYSAQGEASVSAMMELARLQAEQGNRAAAISAYERLIKNPAASAFRTQLLTSLGQAYLEQASLEAAERTFNELLTIKEDGEAVANGRFGLAQLAIQRGDRAAAAELYLQVSREVDDQTLRATALDTLARMYQEAGDNAKALDAYQQLLSTVPARNDAAFAARQGMGDIFASKGEFDRAEKLYLSILAEAESVEVKAGAQMALGRMYLEKGDGPKAVAAFKEVQAKYAGLAGMSTEAQLGLGQAWRAMNETERAINLYRQLADRTSDARVAIQALEALSQLYQEAGRNAEALKVTEQMAARAGEDPEAKVTATLAQAAGLRAQGRYQEALALYDKLQVGNDRNLKQNLLDARAQTWSAMGDHAKAAGAYEALIKEFRENPDTLHNAMMGLAAARRGQGRGQEAVALYQQVATETTEAAMRTWAQESLAQTYAELGQQEKALETMKKAGTAEGGGGKLALANAARARGAADEAVRLYQEVADTGTDSNDRAWALVYAGQVLGDQEKQDEALRQFFKCIQGFPSATEPVLAAKLGIAGIQRARNKGKDALIYYEELARGESFPDYRISAALAAAELQAAEGQRAKAKATLETLLKRFPDKPEAAQGARLGLARVARESGQVKEALAAFLALEASATDQAIKALALAGAGRCYAELGQRDKAAETFRTLRSRYPTQAEALAEADAFLGKR